LTYPKKYFFPIVQKPLVSQTFLIIGDSWSYSDTSHSVDLLHSSDKPDAETST